MGNLTYAGKDGKRFLRRKARVLAAIDEQGDPISARELGLIVKLTAIETARILRDLRVDGAVIKIEREHGGGRTLYTTPSQARFRATPTPDGRVFQSEVML